MSVFLSPIPLAQQKYDVAHVKSGSDEYFRIGRFLTGLATLRSTPFETANIYLRLDEPWKKHAQHLEKQVHAVLPRVQVHPCSQDKEMKAHFYTILTWAKFLEWGLKRNNTADNGFSKLAPVGQFDTEFRLLTRCQNSIERFMH